MGTRVLKDFQFRVSSSQNNKTRETFVRIGYCMHSGEFTCFYKKQLRLPEDFPFLYDSLQVAVY